MDRLQSMKVFVRVAQHSGFAAAARDLHMSKAAVSKHVTALEGQVGTRLFDRTTRNVGLTEAGRIYLDRCHECLQAIEDADASVSALSQEPRGLLRVSTPIDFGGVLLPVIAEVMKAHPKVTVDLQLTNRVIDLVEEGIDVAVRVAQHLEGRFVARPLSLIRLGVYGSPAYLAKHGRPSRPEELAAHRNLVFSEPQPMTDLVFTRGQRRVRVRLAPVMTSNGGDALQAAMLQGVGLAIMPSLLVRREALESGAMERVLQDWSLPERKVFAVYPHRRFLSPKVRVLIEALRRAFGDGTRDSFSPDEPTPVPATRRSSKGRAPLR